MTKRQDTIDRREFTTRSLLALLAGVTVTISGCGDDEPNTPTPVAKTGNISANHGHAATISAAEQTAGGDVVLNIEGQATHNHQVSLSGAQVVQIRSGTQVAITSTSTLGHQHTVTFN